MSFDLFHSLAKKPRIVSLVSVMDGNVFDFKDDGGSVNEQGQMKAHGMRNALLNALGKIDKDGQPVYFAGKRSGEGPASWSWEPADIAPAFPGDPVASAPKLGAAQVAKIKANLAKRAEIESMGSKNQAAELAKLAASVAKGAKVKSDG